ncbi:MAG: hypothetical protein FJ405_09445 [Verrucomicrobia bacterium]|nr:hypothetical protein [Verrucomicrobiota bacterium]
MSKFRKPIFVALAVLLSVCGGFVIRGLDEMRKDPGLGVQEAITLTNAPPMLAFTTVAFGSFRGLIVNALSMRHLKLQDEARFFEMVQLSDWITKLQPNNAAVWRNQAWNMAYNISIRFTSPTDRWRWVNQGIRLLRDQGLLYNPADADIYTELGWFYQHKLGYFLDEAHLFYKSAHYAEWHSLLGPAATNISLLLQPAYAETNQAVLKTLRDVYKMDPVYMNEVHQKYGTGEWRLPETHAVYWGYVGLLKCSDNPNNKEYHLIGLRRLIYQSIQQMWLRGKIVQFTMDGVPETVPDFGLIELADKGFLEAIAEEKSVRGYSIVQARKSFVREVVYQLYVNGRRAEAEKWFKTLQKDFPDGAEGETQMEAYSLKRLKETIQDDSLQRTKLIILGFMAQAIQSEAMNQMEDAENYNTLARTVYEEYQRKFGYTDRVRLQPFENLLTEALRQMLHPETGLYPEMRARVMRLHNIASITNLFPSLTNRPTTNYIFEITNKVDELKIAPIKPPDFQ